MPFVVMYAIFMGVIGCSIQILTGSLDATYIDHILAIIFSVISMGIFIHDMSKGYITRKETHVLIVLFIILVLYALAPSFYGSHWKHMSYLLVFVSETIPAAYIGMRAARTENMNKIGDLLPLFLIPTSLLIGTIGLRYAAMGERVNNDDSGLNYQSLSYIMSYAYAYSVYYVFFHEQQVKSFFCKTLKFIMLLMMFYCALVTLTGGGRGAFVFMIIITVLMALYYIKYSEGQKLHSFIVIGTITVVVIWMIEYFSVMSSAGMERVMGKLTEDYNREVLYETAYEAFLESPIIGNGIGSIWWKVGWYSHNMFLDLLVETGMIGTFIVSVFIINFLFKLNRYTHRDKFYVFLMILIMSAIVRYTFSGYWMSAVRLFMICSWVYCLPRKEVNE